MSTDCGYGRARACCMYQIVCQQGLRSITCLLTVGMGEQGHAVCSKLFVNKASGASHVF